jgi:sulfite reductase (NADPH) flavoprotein alpha-component
MASGKSHPDDEYEILEQMAKDVDSTLRKIVMEQGGKSVEEANEYVENLKRDKRYKRDVY